MDSNNLWLSIPAADYEAHMGSAGTKQLGLLANLFDRVLSTFHPRSVAVLGCATGNGFDRIGIECLDRLVAVDINPEYTNIVRERYSSRIPCLEIVNADICDCELPRESFDLIWCGLFFEHVAPATVLPKLKCWMKQGGVLATVLQLPTNASEVVSDTGVESVKLLAPHTQLVAPTAFKELAGKHGFTELETETATIEGGKSFYLAVFRLSGD